MAVTILNLLVAAPLITTAPETPYINIEDDVDTAKYNYFPSEEDAATRTDSNARTYTLPQRTSIKKFPKNLPSRWGFALMANPGTVLGLDEWARDWLQKKSTFALAGELRYTPQPGDKDHFAEDYNYPTFAVGFRYSFNHGTELHRVNVDYNSQLGDVATIYGKFIRPVIRTNRFELAYYIGTGFGYSHKKYNKTDQVNNEFIGSIWNIYFTGGVQATYKMGREWALFAGLDFSHHSNGALYRPNKGTNYLGPFAGISYTPSTKKHDLNDEPIVKPIDYDKGFFLEFSAGLGGKTLLEDWQYTQWQVDKNSPKYHTTNFSLYGNLSFQTDILYRYARRWASGVGLDVFYSDYANKVKMIDNAKGLTGEKHSPWSVGLALKHEAYYGRFSARMGVGFYLYRHMGYLSHTDEGPRWLYERIGLFYSFPTLRGASIGFSINAHATKADFTEFVISYPIKL